MTVSRRWWASAPVRLDFAGGWTDVAPFATEQGGLVVNAAIDQRVTVEVGPRTAGYQLSSDLQGSIAQVFDHLDASNRDGPDLRTAALRRCRSAPCALHVRSDVPAGSGLGGSGALGVALLGALYLRTGNERTAADLAAEAFELEAGDAALPGGKQDQFAAALGGFHRLTFDGNRVAAVPMILDSAFREALADRIVLCYTGQSRVSSRTIARVMGAYAAGDPVVGGALHRLVEIAHRMDDALRQSDLGLVAALLNANWQCQQALDAGMRSGEMAALERSMYDAGALGGKAAGAGAGGSMFFVVRDRTGAVRAAEEAGARVIPFDWSIAGVRGGEL